MTSTEHAVAMPAAPHRSFASDNAAGIHPTVLQAIVEANEGHALAYGQDDHTARCENAFRELFDADVVTRLTFNGTGANIVALARWLSHTCSLMLQSSQLPANCLRVLHSSQMVNSVESTGVHSTE